MRLHLGVIDVPYSTYQQKAEPESKKGRREVFVWTKIGWVIGTLGKEKTSRGSPRGGPKGSARTPSTADVAGWLESRYGVMHAFYKSNQDQVMNALEESLQGHLENIMMGAPVNEGVMFSEGASRIADSFKKFLSSGAIESLGIPGVPTRAALSGVNHRLKSGRGPRRPSFIDTGLYQSSFIAWVD